MAFHAGAIPSIVVLDPYYPEIVLSRGAFGCIYCILCAPPPPPTPLRPNRRYSAECPRVVLFLVTGYFLCLVPTRDTAPVPFFFVLWWPLGREGGGTQLLHVPLLEFCIYPDSQIPQNKTLGGGGGGGGYYTVVRVQSQVLR